MQRFKMRPHPGGLTTSTGHRSRLRHPHQQAGQYLLPRQEVDLELPVVGVVNLAPDLGEAGYEHAVDDGVLLGGEVEVGA